MKKLFYSILSIAALLSFESKAQQDPTFSHYMYSGIFFNPAYSGLDGVAKFSFLNRRQWWGYGVVDGGGAPLTNILSFHAPLLKYQSGVGGYIMNDQLGPMNNLTARLSYAYHFTVGAGKLSLGIAAGTYGTALRGGFEGEGGVYRAIDRNDAAIPQSDVTKFKPDMAFGAWYKTEKYYAGLSVNHLIRSKFDFATGNSADNALERHLYLTGGYHWEATYDLIITPSALVKLPFYKLAVSSAAYQIDFNVMGTYKEKFWGGLSYRQGDAITALVGVHALKDKSLSIGLATDFSLPNVEAKRLLSTEVYLAYSLPVVLKGSKPIIRTPRYRK
jgi:type IX secretion system PorP/SprF family membrane protein